MSAINISDTLIDFFVDVKENRDIKVLQITDTQIIDSSQKRDARHLSSDEDVYWSKKSIDERCFNTVRGVISKVEPDLIIITGDLIYGEFDDSGTSLLKFIEFMESFKIPWAPVFGNHDNESAKGADWQSEKLSKAEHCLFKQRNLTGNGNYTVGIKSQGVLKRVFVMLDSNGCGALSEASLKNGHSKSSPGFGSDQINWYSETISEIRGVNPEVKISFAFHIQPFAFENAMKKYGFDNNRQSFAPVNIDLLKEKTEGDFGYIGNVLKDPWDIERAVWQGIKSLGVDSVFVGHEHANSAGVIYDGIRCQYGQKTGTYDRNNYLQEDGSYICSYLEAGVPISGGTAIFISQDDGLIKETKIILSDN